MRTTIRNSILLLTAGIMALALSGDGLANEKQRDAHKKPNTGEFTVAGRYTGLLDGVVEVGGRSVLITKDTKVYVSGKGFVETPMLYGDAIYVMGKRTDSGSHARMIIVRPIKRNQPTILGDRTGKLPPDAEL